MVNFSEIATYLSQSEIVELSIKSLGSMESDLLFSIACEKDRIRREKVKGVQKLTTTVIVNNTNFGNISKLNDFGPVNILLAGELLGSTNDTELLSKLDNSLIITTSNIFSEIGIQRLASLYEKLPKSLFAIHDYDNHHWISNNLQSAIFADIYIPSHQDEYLLATRVNPNVIGGIPCGSNQWSMDFINEYAKDLCSIGRTDLPLGKYYFYEKFVHRNKTITTLNQIYPSIRLLQNDFHSLTQEEKGLEWSNHKLHWIIPVLNDLPIRFFDALITGGLPLIPTGLKPFVSALGVPRSFYLEYSPLDILDSKNFIEKANEYFDASGLDGILARHQYAVKNFHIDVILNKIIASSYELYGVKP